MCGFAGWWEIGATVPLEEASPRLRRMTDQMVSRGPDEEGTWVDPSAGVALGFRRLAILDLTPTGHQPMISGSGRLVMVFNGEVYNHQELRKELEADATHFRGRSDTEVVLQAIEHWGLEAALPRLNGMFALAIWDRGTHELSLARDRFGKKPLYYGWAGRTLLFGSTLAALRRHPAFDASVDPDALAAYLGFAYVPAPQTIFRGFRKLPQGSFLRMKAPAQGALEQPQSYWDPRQAAAEALRNPFHGSLEEAEGALEGLLSDAVALRMVADVPVGAFLSGGIDSSLVVALMKAQGGSVRTFSIGFPEQGFDEAPYARAVAAHLGTDHTELYVEGEQARGVIPALASMYDEPFADSSQIPTYLVSRLARTQVTVALSGDGGDEVFAGYDRYRVGQSLAHRFGWVPGPMRSLLGTACEAMPAGAWDRSVGALFGPRLSARRLRKLGMALRSADFTGQYREMMAYWPDPWALVPGSQRLPDIYSEPEVPGGPMDPVGRMRLLDLRSYLVDDILVKVDRASMAVSLEVRNPLLDYRVHDFAWSLPGDYLWTPASSKRILRRILHRHVPASLVERPKMGFGVPLGQWLRGPLRPWAEDLLRPASLEAHGLNPLLIRDAWVSFLKGPSPIENNLWSVLMYQQWRVAPMCN